MGFGELGSRKYKATFSPIHSLAWCPVHRPASNCSNCSKSCVAQVSLITLPVDFPRSDTYTFSWKLKPVYGPEILFSLSSLGSCLIVPSCHFLMHLGLCLLLSFILTTYSGWQKIWGKKEYLIVVFLIHLNYILSWDFGDGFLRVQPMSSGLKWKKSML